VAAIALYQLISAILLGHAKGPSPATTAAVVGLLLLLAATWLMPWGTGSPNARYARANTDDYEDAIEMGHTP